MIDSNIKNENNIIILHNGIFISMCRKEGEAVVPKNSEDAATSAVNEPSTLVLSLNSAGRWRENY